MLAIDLNLDGDEAWALLADRRDKIVHLKDTPIAVAVLDGGMASGKPSVAIRLDLPDGRVVVAETSWALLYTTTRAIEARYGSPDDDRKERP